MDRFSSCHPITQVIFWIAVIVGGVCVHHPAYSLCALLFASFYYLRLFGRDGVPYLGGIAGIMVLITLLNPVFNPLGNTVLFTWLRGRAFTLEALLYGGENALMIGSILIWFSCFNKIMTGDRWLYLFGGAAPAFSMVLTMVLRLVPGYTKKARRINRSRMAIGRSSAGKSRKEQIKDGSATLTALLGMALEGGVATGDSMQARGYGAGKRSRYVMYKFSTSEMLLVAIMAVLAISLLYCLTGGGAAADYIPAVTLTGFSDNRFTAGLFCWALLHAIPTILGIYEDITWHRLKSEI